MCTLNGFSDSLLIEDASIIGYLLYIHIYMTGKWTTEIIVLCIRIRLAWVIDLINHVFFDYMAMFVKRPRNLCNSVYTISRSKSDFCCVQKQMYYMFTAYTHIKKLYQKQTSQSTSTSCTMLHSRHHYQTLEWVNHRSWSIYHQIKYWQQAQMLHNIQ